MSEQILMAQIGFILAQRASFDELPDSVEELTELVEKYYGFKPTVGAVLIGIRDKLLETEKHSDYDRAMKII